MNIYMLRHPKTKSKILKSMERALKTSSVSHVENNKGEAFIAVRYKDGRFTFVDCKGIDLYYLIRFVLGSYAISDRIQRLKNKNCYTYLGRII